VDEKPAFFDEWHVLYVDWGTSYGRELASAENSELLGQLADQCEETEQDRFQEILGTFDDLSDVLIIAARIWLPGFFARSEQYKPKWRPDIPKLDVGGFEGWYSFNGHDIPIIETYQSASTQQMLVLRRSKMGRLIQYSPLKEGEGDELKSDILCMLIESFSEKKELADQFVEKPPDWLKSVGDEQKQREHLRELVVVNILERFEYSRDKDFKGYRLKLQESTPH
jgi:hypothetical protein